jgi:hypothetical protein
MSDIKKTMEAYLSMVSETADLDEGMTKAQAAGARNRGESKLDPVDDKANDKKFKDRKDKDIDNDGDVDSSDEFLHKRRKAIDNEKDGGEKPAKNEKVKAKEGETEAEKDEKEADSVEADGETEDKPKVDPKKKKKLPNKDDGDDTPEISKIGEASAEFIKDLEDLLEKMKAGTEPEKIDSKESPKSKEFIAKHKIDKMDHEDMEKVLPPKEPKLKKEMAEFEVIRALLSGKPLDGE